MTTTSPLPVGDATRTEELQPAKLLRGDVANAKDGDPLLAGVLQVLASFSRIAAHRTLQSLDEDYTGKPFRGSRLELDLMKQIYQLYPSDELWEAIGDKAAYHFNEHPNGDPLFDGTD